MKAIVAYESMYGNTHRVAEAIAEGLVSLGQVAVMPVAQAAKESMADIDVLVVGGPTHVHGMSRTASRSELAERCRDRVTSG